MGQSYRIKTELGVNKTINVQLDQDFEFLEILSLKIQQADVYTRSCADYGVIVGRVTANNGFGIPNARVSIFIPITPVDESNPVISSIYPYKSPTDKNEDGYRYNLLPYEKSYSAHAATGTLPNREDSLIDATAVEIYDTYYKYTTKTNESGDYMIMGAPLGVQTLVMDVDLSDIGEFSLTPQDLIRMGLATEGQVAGNRFRTSNDLSSLPQIVSLTKQLDVSPLWGDPDICQIAVNRMDFDLRDDANIDIQPTSVFMGSIYSTADSFRLRRDARPRDDMGNLCSLSTGPGQILAIRQTIQEDSEGNPILEQFQLEQSGNIIDGNGVWMTELPMNLDYFITNEFGEKVLSNDTTVGIPTKGRYRFKIKWSQSSSVSEQTRRPNFLVPNVKEYGWANTTVRTPNQQRQEGSYYFGLDWSGYTKGFNSEIDLDLKNKILDSKINCEDTFYEFNFNKVYTVSGFIDQFKNGGVGRFIGIKEIDSQECEDTVNKFPVNDGFKNFDLLYFLFSILMMVIQLIGPILLTIYHLLAFLWNNFSVPLGALLAYMAGKESIWNYSAIGWVWPSVGLVAYYSFMGTFYLGIAAAIIVLVIKKWRFRPLKLPMITYPECQTCQCNLSGGDNEDDTSDEAPETGLLSQLSINGNYVDNLTTLVGSQYTALPPYDESFETNVQSLAVSISQAVGGVSTTPKNPYVFKSNQSSIYRFADGATRQFYSTGLSLPPGERINIYNTRKKYFDGVNKIKVTFSYPNNGDGNFHYDNTLTVLSTQDVEPGTIFSFVNPNKSKDKNYLWSGLTQTGGYVVNGINGIITTSAFTTNVSYANPTSPTESLSTTYNIPSSSSECYINMVVKVVEPGTLTYNTCAGNLVTVPFISGPITPENPDGEITPDFPIITGLTNYDGINITTTGGTSDYSVLSYSESSQRYVYPSDIEYYQVLTAITITKTIVNGQAQYSIPNLGNGTSFWSTLNAPNNVVTLSFIPTRTLAQDAWVPVGPPNYNQWIRDNSGIRVLSQNAIINYPTSNFIEYESQKVLILQRGVDPYSPLLMNKYGIGKILGHPTEDAVTFTAMTRMNIPIQELPTNNVISVQKHNSQDNIFKSSYVYSPGIPGQTTPGLNFSSFTTPNVGYYSALDSNFSDISLNGITFNSTNYVQNFSPSLGLTGVRALRSNLFYNNNPSDTLYDGSEDLSGGALMYRSDFQFNFQSLFRPTERAYYSPILYPDFTGTTELNISNSNQIIMRTDRLPSSDYIDNLASTNGNVSLLQQNAGFAIYPIGEGNELFNSSSISMGASITTAEIDGLPVSGDVLKTLGDCENMVGLNCYQSKYDSNGVKTLFEVKPGCQSNDSVENGCYVFVRKPIKNLGRDLDAFNEWGFRFNFFYALCRGVLSQSFMNNWVNGSLYMFPIQVDIYYDRNNQPSNPSIPSQVAYFDKSSNNFYYRSSPFQLTGSNGGGKFIGKPTTGLSFSVNTRNLLYPTTIINLGIKDDFYKEIIFDPSAKGYIMRSLNPTSYSDTSDLVNLFVISRITDEGFLQRIVTFGNNSIQQLFNRTTSRDILGRKRRIDGDLAQVFSINSEFGVIPFSPQFYQVTGSDSDPVRIVGPMDNPTMVVFFSSTTQDLQNKDYLTPGVIDFRPSNNANAITYKYGIKSQEVPFYQWNIRPKTESGVFGTERNNWLTNSSDIFSRNYQSLDRRDIITPSYFIPPNYQVSDTFARGYIFNVSGSSYDNYTYSLGSELTDVTRQVLVGAPNHFYFGVIKGESALDKFKEKYSIDE